MNKLPSEEVIVEAPMSWTGATKRIWRAERGWEAKTDETGLVYAAVILAAVVTALAWVTILAWYLVFGIFLIPYRVVRRGQRSRKRDELRHREMVAAQARR
jgi:uncharacterized membrane-anchored protein